MSFEELEESRESSKFIELYKFTFINNGSIFALTNGPNKFDWYGYTYLPVEIKRQNLDVAKEFENSGSKLEVATSTALVQKLIEHSVRERIQTEMIRVQLDDLSFATIFKGYLLNFSCNGPLTELDITPPSVYMSRTMLLRRYSIICPYVLYDSSSCRAINNLFEVEGVIESRAGSEISSPILATKADDYFTNGYVSIGNTRYMIYYHVGNTIRVSGSFDQSVGIGTIFRAYAGCDHTTDHCLNKFSNLDNFGGFPWIPSKNPFVGDPIV